MSTQETTASILDSEGNAAGGSTDSGTDGLREARDRYRTERDASRQELTAAQARIERMQRAEVERVAGEYLAMPGDLFSLSGNELADYLDDDGNVDPEKVTTDVAAVLTERPGLRKNAPAFDPTQGTGGGKPKPGEPSLAAMIKGTVADPWSARR
ncbi:hypothetical protein LRS71_17765 [Rhodococcus pyridinivorans]|uniref:hypothetical protein n=1 Tax=Rhodococcus pyridinivorans TaxID=103816 RepID=UPI001E4BA4BF|nr:hypothetical protein [Rhodococcus pyridinivorans]MCD5421383.1 hypothetical protein [Rhodococcus pyridinivorans]